MDSGCFSSATPNCCAAAGMDHSTPRAKHLTDAACLHREAFMEHHPAAACPGRRGDALVFACRDGGVDLDERYYRAQTAFVVRAFARVRRWLMDGSARSTRYVPSSGRRRRPPCRMLDCHVLPHLYLHLLPWSAPHDEPEG
jgi:hypothetical protein